MSSQETKQEHSPSDGERRKESYDETRSPESHSTEDEHMDGGDVEKVLSKASKASVRNISSVPNGGLTAWLQVLGAWCLFFNTWGILNTFGVYQTYYERGELFEASSSTISWIGAVQAFCLLLVGALTGPIYDAGYFRHLIGVGSFMVVFGQMMLSLCHEFWQCLLAQGFCVGIGAGLMFVPSVAIMSTYFTTRIAFAIGIAASGSSIGGVIYPIVLFKLQPTIGFAWATRVLGFMMLATLIFPNVVMRMRVKPGAKRKLIDLTALKEPQYVFFVLASFLGFMGLYIPFFYIQYYAIQTGIMDPGLAFYLLAILNAASTFGRIIPNFIADKTGPLNIMGPCAYITGILVLGLLGIHSKAGVIVFCVLFGFFSGTYVSLPPSSLVSLTPDRALIGTRMGMCFTVVSFGVLAGTPVAGAILGTNNFRGVWIFGGVLPISGGVLFTISRYFQAGPKLLVKA